MKQRRIRFTRTAQTHVEHERAWWLENRDHTEVFAEEFEQAVRLLAVLPGAGTPHGTFPALITKTGGGLLA